MALRDAKRIWKVGIAAYGVALIVYIVGFATRSWFIINGIDYFGLFDFCNIQNGACVSLADNFADKDIWLTGAALTSTGLALLVIGGILSVVAQAFDKAAVVGTAGASLIIIGGICGATGVIYHVVRGSELIRDGGEFSVPWKSITYISSTVVEIIAGIMLLSSYFRRPTSSDSVQGNQMSMHM